MQRRLYLGNDAVIVCDEIIETLEIVLIDLINKKNKI